MAAKERLRSVETGEGFYQEKNIFWHGSTEENESSRPNSGHTNAESGIDWSGSIAFPTGSCARSRNGHRR